MGEIIKRGLFFTFLVVVAACAGLLDLGSLNDQGSRLSASGKYQDAIDYWERGLKAAKEAQDWEMAGIFAANIGFAYDELNRPDSAEEKYQEGILYLRKGGSVRSLAHALMNLGQHRYKQRRLSPALALYQEAISLLEQCPECSLKAQAHGWAGYILIQLGEYGEAAKTFNEYLLIAKKLDDKGSMLNALVNLGAVHGKMDEAETALDYYRRAFELGLGLNHWRAARELLWKLEDACAKFGDRTDCLPYFDRYIELEPVRFDIKGLRYVLTRAGDLAMQRHEFERAASYMAQAVELSRQGGNQLETGRALGNLAAVHSMAGEYEKAGRLFEESLRYLEPGEDKGLLAHTLHNIGVFYRRTGEHVKALSALTRSLALGREIESTWIIGASLVGLAAVHEKKGKTKEAMAYYEEAESVIRQYNHDDLLKELLHNKRSFFSGLGQAGKGLALLEEEISLINRSGRPLSSDDLISLGLAHVRNGEYANAIELYRRAADMSRDTRDMKSYASALNSLGVAYSQLGKSDEALPCYHEAMKVHQEQNDLSGVGTNLVNIGVELKRLKDFEGALARLKESREIKEDLGQATAGVQCNLADVYLQMNMPEQAEKEISRVGCCPFPSARMHIMKGRYEQAVETLCAELDKKDGQMFPETAFAVHCGLGYAYLGLEQYEQALENFEKVIGLIERQLHMVSSADRKVFIEAEPYIFHRYEAYQGIIETLNRLGRTSDVKHYSDALESLLRTP